MKEEFKKSKLYIEEKEKLLRSKKSFLEENAKLGKEIENLKLMLEKFTYGSQKLQIILNSQKAIFNKAGIGYNSLRK